MEFGINVQTLLGCDGAGIAILTPDRFKNRNMQYFDQIAKIIDAMGEGSARAQGLYSPITSVAKLYANGHTCYVSAQQDKCIGLLKVGVKKLFIRNQYGEIKEIQPLCVLDFYVHESIQRGGYGKQLFEIMLANEGVQPHQLAYDRPSPKLLGFLRKHYNLTDFVPQTNNFVVFHSYFEGSQRNMQTMVNRHQKNSVQRSDSTSIGGGGGVSGHFLMNLSQSFKGYGMQLMNINRQSESQQQPNSRLESHSLTRGTIGKPPKRDDRLKKSSQSHIANSNMQQIGSLSNTMPAQIGGFQFDKQPSQRMRIPHHNTEISTPKDGQPHSNQHFQPHQSFSGVFPMQTGNALKQPPLVQQGYQPPKYNHQSPSQRPSLMSHQGQMFDQKLITSKMQQRLDNKFSSNYGSMGSPFGLAAPHRMPVASSGHMSMGNGFYGGSPIAMAGGSFANRSPTIGTTDGQTMQSSFYNVFNR